MKLHMFKPTSTNLAPWLDLVTLGGAVEADGLEERMRRARLLVGAYDGDNLVGCCALKAPSESYRSRLGNLPEVEFGWLVVRPEFRHRGLARIMRQAVLGGLYAGPAFATRSAEVREEFGLGFRQVGEFEGRRGRLALLVRP